MRVARAASGLKNEAKLAVHMQIISFSLNDPATNLKDSAQLKRSVILSA